VWGIFIFELFQDFADAIGLDRESAVLEVLEVKGK